jgi:hypothetical protein
MVAAAMTVAATKLPETVVTALSVVTPEQLATAETALKAVKVVTPELADTVATVATAAKEVKS